MEKHSFPLQEEATEQTPHMDSSSMSRFVCNPSCCFVICKTRKTNYFLRERRDLTFPSLQVTPARWLQEESAARCPTCSPRCGWRAPSQTFN